MRERYKYFSEKALDIGAGLSLIVLSPIFAFIVSGNNQEQLHQKYEREWEKATTDDERDALDYEYRRDLKRASFGRITKVYFESGLDVMRGR